jgi:hypothetical protein
MSSRAAGQDWIQTKNAKVSNILESGNHLKKAKDFKPALLRWRSLRDAENCKTRTIYCKVGCLMPRWNHLVICRKVPLVFSRIEIPFLPNKRA